MALITEVVISSLGIAVVLFVLTDFIRTTLQLEGAGALTRVVNRSVWRAALFLTRRRAGGRRMLSSAGVIALLSSLVSWVVLLWLGWLLFFLPHHSAVISSSAGSSADFWSRAYFIGYSIITLGVGDFRPAGAPFQMATVVAAIIGFFLLTLSVTYFVPVVSAVVQVRQLASLVFLMGHTPAQMITGGREGGVSQEFLRVAPTLAGQIVLLSLRNYAYPVLRYFPGKERETSAAMAVAALDEALTLLLHGTRRHDRVQHDALRSVRNAIEIHLQREAATGDLVDAVAPPLPSLDALRRAGVATVEDDEFASLADRLAERRKLLLVLILKEDWEWRDVHGAEVTR